MKTLFTNPTAQKDITLPSHGLYNSVIGTELDSAMDNYGYDISDDKQADYETFVNSDAYCLAARKVNERMILEYGQHLIDVINDEYDFKIIASNFEYVPMNGRNQGDTLHCMIDVDTLPPLEYLDKIIDGFSASLARLAIDRLSSYDGFISFYEKDMTPLLNKPYNEWGDAYIMLLIELLMTETGKDVSDIEMSYFDKINGYGGSIEYLFDALSEDDTAVLNDLLDE